MSLLREKYVVLTRKDLVITRKDLVITRQDVVLTRKDLVITRKYVVLTRKHVFHNDISSLSKYFFSNERLDFCDKKNIKRINNAD